MKRMVTRLHLGPDRIGRDARVLAAALINADINTHVPFADHIRAAAIAGVLLAGAFFTANAHAQLYPAKPVRAVFPISPGSSLDIVGRLVMQKLSEAWGQQVVVDNRPGAGGTLGTALVARAPADGYTLLVSGISQTINTVLYTQLPYNAQQDFIEIAPIASMYQVLAVAPSLGIKSVAQLVALAKAKPGHVTFGSAGIGSGAHFAAEKLRLAMGVDVLHVPYKGGPEAMNDVMMARIHYWLPTIGTALPFIHDNRLLALGVTSPKRSALLPDVPTLIEAGVAGYEESLWFGIWAPRGVSAGIVEKIAKDVARTVDLPALREPFRKLAAEPLHLTPVEFARFVRRENDSVKQIAKAAGIRAQ